MWKYVDDVSLDEGLTKTSTSSIQSILDIIASDSRMKLNAKKSKEMRVCFLSDTPNLSQLKIDDQHLELVTSHKVFGKIQSNLKWNIHIHDTVKKSLQMTSNPTCFAQGWRRD